VYEHGESLRLENVLQDGSVWQPDWIREESLAGFIGVPIWDRARNEIVGVIAALSREGAREFTQTDEDTLVTLADLGAVTIRTARAFELLRDALSRMQKLATAAGLMRGDFSTQELADGLADACAALLEADSVYVCLTDPSWPTPIEGRFPEDLDDAAIQEAVRRVPDDRLHREHLIQCSPSDEGGGGRARCDLVGTLVRRPTRHIGTVRVMFQEPREVSRQDTDALALLADEARSLADAWTGATAAGGTLDEVCAAVGAHFTGHCRPWHRCVRMRRPRAMRVRLSPQRRAQCGRSEKPPPRRLRTAFGAMAARSKSWNMASRPSDSTWAR